MRQPYDRMATETAIHKAGHAVAHIRLGMEVGTITIVEKGNNVGAMSGPGIHHAMSDSDVHAQGVALMAGYAALVATGYPEGEAMGGVRGKTSPTWTNCGRWGGPSRRYPR